MRIGFVPAARLLSEVEPNGEALIAVQFLRALAERGHEVTAWCERAEVRIDGVQIREVSPSGPTAALGRIAFARRIAREAARERFDVLHLLFPFTTADGYSLANGAPLVVGPVNLPWPDGRRKPFHARLTGVVERRLHARTLRRAARIFATGRTSAAALPPERTIELPFGVDTDRFAPTPVPAEPVILFFSVLLRRKGVEVLLRAMPHVLERIPRVRLVIAGADPHGLRPALEQLAAGLPVTFAGPVAPAEAPSVYARARVVCQPSLGEPFGMTVIEAMASGRPVVGTCAGGIPDAIVDRAGGRLVAPGDARLLATALCDVLEGDAGQMGIFNRVRAEERYALVRVVDRLEKVYAEVRGREVSHVAA